MGFVDNTCFQSEKTDSHNLFKTKMHNILFKGRSSYESSLIFIKSLFYFIDSMELHLPLFIALIFFSFTPEFSVEL